MILTIVIGIVVFFSAVGIDFANTRYVQAVGDKDPHRAARWSVLQWVSSLVGFIVAVKITLWMLPVEMLGLYVGTWWSMRNSRNKQVGPEGYKGDVSRRSKDEMPGVPTHCGCCCRNSQG